jgi:hypothetical protein
MLSAYALKRGPRIHGIQATNSGCVLLSQERRFEPPIDKNGGFKPPLLGNLLAR